MFVRISPLGEQATVLQLASDMFGHIFLSDPYVRGIIEMMRRDRVIHDIEVNPNERVLTVTVAAPYEVMLTIISEKRIRNIQSFDFEVKERLHRENACIQRVLMKNPLAKQSDIHLS